MDSDRKQIRTQSQRFAAEAYEHALGAAQKGNRDKYKTAVLGFPALIQSCGLAQAIAFAKSKEDYKPYFDDLNKIVKEVTDSGSLETQVIKAKLTEYMKLTRDTLEAASWLKRYVEAEFKNGEGE